MPSIHMRVPLSVRARLPRMRLAGARQLDAIAVDADITALHSGLSGVDGCGRLALTVGCRTTGSELEQCRICIV